MLREIFLLLTIQYTASELEQFSGIASKNGSLSSPSFPSGYKLDGSSSTYCITNRANGAAVQLLFTDLDIHPRSVLEIYSAAGQGQCQTPSQASWRQLGRIGGGDQDQERIYHSDNVSTLIIVFSRGCCGFANVLGFKATYTFVTYSLESWTSRPFTRCGALTDFGGNLTLSTVFERQNASGRNVDCYWLLKPSITLAHLAKSSSNASRSSVLQYAFDLITYRLLRNEDGRGELTIRDGLTSSSNVLLRYDLNLVRRQSTVFNSSNNSAGLYIRLTAKALARFDFSYYVLYNLTAAARVGQNVDCPEELPFRCGSEPRCIDGRLVCDRVAHCTADQHAADENKTICKGYRGWPMVNRTLATRITTQPTWLANSGDQREPATGVGVFDSKPLIIAGCVMLTLLLCCVTLIGIVIALKRGHLKWLRSHAARMFDQNDLDHSLFPASNRVPGNAPRRHKHSVMQRLLYMFRPNTHSVAELTDVAPVENAGSSSAVSENAIGRLPELVPHQPRPTRTTPNRTDKLVPRSRRVEPDAVECRLSLVPSATHSRAETGSTRQSHSRSRIGATPLAQDVEDTAPNDDASSVCSNFTRLTPPPYSTAVRL